MRTGVATVLAALVMSLLPATAASAATVYEITAQWADGSPTEVATGETLGSEWRVNVNDDRPAPSNDPVDNVTFTATYTNATVASIPDACLTTGVTPASSISADGRTLVCNIGTKEQGTSHVVQVPVRAEGGSGDEITASGSIGTASAGLPPIVIDNPFAMDMVWQSPTNVIGWNDTFVDIDVQWTLFLQRGSDAGPTSVSYTLDVTNAVGAPVSVGPNGCTPFTSGVAIGHPWSGGSHPADQMAPFPGTCTITPTAVPGRFTMTISGIDYSQAAVPARDSAGRALPTDRAAVASGSIWLRFASGANNTMTLVANAPTYTSVTGDSFVDDASNNQSNKTWTRGGWVNAWQPEATGVTVPSWWSDEFRVSPGTEVQSVTNWRYHPSEPSTLNGQCNVLDTKYVEFLWAELRLNWDGGPVPGAKVEYYTGNSPLVSPTSSSYDPNAFRCADDPGGWTTTLPADLTTVKAVRATYPGSAWADYDLTTLNVRQRIKSSAPIGMDVWEWGAALAADGTWTHPNRSMDPADRDGGPLTPGARYPFIGSGRDIVRIIGVLPDVTKSVDRSSVRPGIPATYTLTYSANGTGAVPPTVDDFSLVDTLPVGLSYVAGSSTPEPQVSTDAQGRQVLTWSLDEVPTNALRTLTYQAVAAETVTPGTVLTNSVVASVNGETSTPATAGVIVSVNGSTLLSKTTGQWFIANPDGDGSGETGTWTITLRSQDPLPQAFTDTIDILPYNGDGRGTDFAGTYDVTAVNAPAGATVYYTTADVADLSDDPSDDSNGAAPGSIAGNTVGWSTTPVANPTAIRVIGGRLAPGATFAFTVEIEPNGAQPGDVYVNRAQAIAEHTELVMRTSEPLTMGTMYSASLKKYVQDANGDWVDANDVTEYPTYRVGDEVPYRIVIENTGQGTLTDLTITDDLFPEGSFTVDELAPGEEQSHEFTVTMSGGGTVVNTACGTAAMPEDSTVAPAINCDPAGVEVANYRVVKTADPASGETVKPGDEVTYRVTVTQEGTVPAVAQFSDDLSKVLDDATLTAGPTASIGTATITDGVLSWSGTVPVDGVATVTYTVTVKDAAGLAADGDYALKNQVTSPGCVTAGDCTTEHPVGTYTVSKTSVAAPGSEVAVGDTITYTVTVAQRGTGAVTGASFDDDLSAVLDDATWNGDLAASDGKATFDADASQLTWTGDLGVDAVVTITYSVTVTGEGDMTLTNVVAPGENGECVPAADGNDGCSTTHTTGRFVFSKMADPAHNTDVQAGDVVTYTVTVAQQGPAGVAASLVDDLSDVLDDATYNGDAVASAGTVAVDGSTLSWSGDLGVGDVVTITYSVTVTGAGNTTLANVVTSPSPAGECVAAEDGTEDCRTVHKTGGYVYAKTADPASGSTVHEGEKVTYTVTVTQRGEGAVTDAIVTDDLSGVLDHARWNDDAAATGGTVTRDGDVLTWTGDLAVGQTVTITYSVTVTATGKAELRNVVTSPDERAICDPDGVCVTTHEVPPVPPLAITGGTIGWGAAGAAGILLIAGAVLFLVRKRREDQLA